VGESREEDGGNNREEICGRFASRSVFIGGGRMCVRLGFWRRLGELLHARNGAARGGGAEE
jgi:hypothetical protein